MAIGTFIFLSSSVIFLLLIPGLFLIKQKRFFCRPFPTPKNIGYALIHVTKHKILSVSPHFLKILGTPDEKAILPYLISLRTKNGEAIAAYFTRPSPLDQREKSSRKEIVCYADDGRTFFLTIYPHKKEKIMDVWLEDITSFVRMRQDFLKAKNLNEKFITLLETVPHPLWIFDNDHRLEFVNQAYADCIGKDRATVLKEDLSLLRNKVPIKEPQVTRKHVVMGGDRHLIEIHIEPKQNANVGYAINLTEQEKREKELKRHIDAHHEILEYLSPSIAIYGSDMKLKFFNHAYRHMFGHLGHWLHSEPTLSEVLEDLRARRLLPEQADFLAYKKKQFDLFKILTSPQHELLHLPDGRTLRTVVVPHPLGGIIFMYEDVTDSLTLERQYNTLIAVQKATIDNLYEGIAVFSSDNRLRLSNPSFNRVWKLEDGSLTPGTPLADVIELTKNRYFTGGEEWRHTKERIIKNVTDRIPKEGKLELLDQTVLEFSYVPLPDGANLLSYIDATARHRIEKMLRERNEALETADQIKTEFLTNISYTLRSPFNTIIGFSEILLNQYFGEINDQQKEYVEGILNASNHLLSLINDILDLSSIEAGQMVLKCENIDIYSLIQSVVELLQKKITEHNHQVIIKCPVNARKFFGDEKRLKQAIYNLISNAIQFTPNGGKIKIQTERNEKQFIIRISDTGVGIPPEDQDRVFRIFEKGLDKDRKIFQTSAGLGLSLVKSFIELHQGQVDITSKINEGTIVTCYLPILNKDMLSGESKNNESILEQNIKRL